LRLYTIYGPPEHMEGAIHKTKAKADASQEHFDRRTTVCFKRSLTADNPERRTVPALSANAVCGRIQSKLRHIEVTRRPERNCIRNRCLGVAHQWPTPIRRNML